MKPKNVFKVTFGLIAVLVGQPQDETQRDNAQAHANLRNQIVDAAEKAGKSLGMGVAEWSVDAYVWTFSRR